MLVLTRKPREEIRIGNGITVTILRVKGQSVRIGIDAPKDVHIVRGELESDGHSADSPNRTEADTTPESPQHKARLDASNKTDRSASKASGSSHSLPNAPVLNRIANHQLRSTPQAAEISSCRIARPSGHQTILKALAAKQLAKRDESDSTRIPANSNRKHPRKSS